MRPKSLNLTSLQDPAIEFGTCSRVPVRKEPTRLVSQRENAKLFGCIENLEEPLRRLTRLLAPCSHLCRVLTFTARSFANCA